MTQPAGTSKPSWNATSPRGNQYLEKFTKVVIFPTSADIEGITKLTRRTPIPNTFESLSGYKSIFISALYEDMNFAIFAMAENFHKTFKKLGSNDASTPGGEDDSVPSCSHGKAVMRVVKKPGPNNGKAFYACPGAKENSCSFFKWIEGGSDNKPSTIKLPKDPRARETLLRKFGVKYYSNCDFIVKRPHEPTFFQKKSFAKFFNKQSAHEEEHKPKGDIKYFLKLPKKAQYEDYSKDDIWVLSTNASFDTSSSEEKVVCMRSSFYGVSTSSMIELLPIGSRPTIPSGSCVYAIKTINGTSHFAMIDNLASMSADSLGFIPCLIGSCKHSKPDGSAGNRTLQSLHRRTVQSPNHSMSLLLSKAEIDRIISAEMKVFNLNEDQERVIWSCTKWFYPQHIRQEAGEDDNVVLVHGIFGSGKSFLLIALIIVVCKLLEISQNKNIRILVAALTNTAVDRILQGLIDKVPFVRVGNIKRIAKNILPFLLAKTTKESEKEAERDLKELLYEASPADIPHIQQALDDLKSGRMAQRAEKLKTYRVVD